MPKEIRTIYFSHPLASYGTPESLMVLKELQKTYSKYKIIDPEDIDGLYWESCQDCMKNIMKKVFFPLIKKCEIFSIWAPKSTCGIECELSYAWQIGKPVIYLSLSLEDEVEIEDLTLKEYHDVKLVMETV